MRKRILPILLALWLFLLPAITVLAYANPNSILFGSGSVPLYRAFYNVQETGDMLFMAESYVHYTTAPNITASDAFLFELIDTDNITVLLAKPIIAYEDKVIGIYQTQNQTATLGLTDNASYSLRITGNPSIFPSPTEGVSMVTKTLAISDWYNLQPSTVQLRIFSLLIATNIQTSSGITLLVNVSGVNYINSAGANIFLAGVPGLNVYSPNLFSTQSAPLTSTPATPTGDLAVDWNVNTQMGNVIGNGLTNLGLWIGVSQSMASGVVWIILTVALALWAYAKTQKTGIPVVTMVLLTLAGGGLGFINLGILLVIFIVVVVLTGMYFFGRVYLGS